MARPITLVILSDIHYACAAERARGDDYELRGMTSRFWRLFIKVHHRFFWLHRQLHQNHLLDQFIAKAGQADFVVANGDYSCDTAFVGVSDDAACESARMALTKLRTECKGGFYAILGDHEMGKHAFITNNGGMRLASFQRAQTELGLQPFWRLELGRYILLGVTSSLIALPIFEQEIRPEEWDEWKRLREEHLEKIRAAFSGLQPDQRVILFCHDPTALPFLGREPAVRDKLAQIEQTIIGHLHSNFIFGLSNWLAGLPTLNFLGSSVSRMSAGLGERKFWKPFRVRLCPSLSGIELFKDGAFLRVKLDPDAKMPAEFQTHRIDR